MTNNKIVMRLQNGQFAKGNVPWNKGLFGYMGANKTSFTKESIETKRKIGKPRTTRDGCVCSSEEKKLVKKKNGKAYYNQQVVSYSRWLIEKQLGRKLETNEVIYHIDGDKYNNELSNLEIISRKELLKRNIKIRKK